MRICLILHLILHPHNLLKPVYLAGIIVQPEAMENLPLVTLFYSHSGSSRQSALSGLGCKLEWSTVAARPLITVLIRLVHSMFDSA